MSAKILGLTSSQIVPQSDFSLSESENGGAEATQSFLILKGGLDSFTIRNYFTQGKRLDEVDPYCDRIWANLRIFKISNVKTVEGGWTIVTASFTGYSSSSDATGQPEPAPQPTYAKRGTVQETPLSEHRKWKALTSPERYALGLLINGDAVPSEDLTRIGVFQESGAFGELVYEGAAIVLGTNAIEFARLINEGQTTYLKPSVTYTHTWQSENPIDEAESENLGMIEIPSGNPSKPAGRDWLLAGTNQVQSGSGGYMYTNELEYILSDDGGHNEFLYAP